jgi:FkbM family methyltransferase
MKRQVKELAKRTFPSVWIKWRMLHRPRSAERELTFLDKILDCGAPGRHGVSVDVGANWGLYTRELARLSRQVHAFEPSHQMAEFLRRTAPANVAVHEIALSDHGGEAELVIPRIGEELVHSLASIEPHATADDYASEHVAVQRLDSIVREDVCFVKIDVEGHELHVLDGACGLLDRCRPIFLVEAEERHRTGATQSIFRFFHDRGYDGFFIKDDDILGVDDFDAPAMQDPDALLPDGGRRDGCCYINNFFYFPRTQDGLRILRR